MVDMLIYKSYQLSSYQSLYFNYFFCNSLFQARAEEEQYMLPSGIATTAEPRPNAYVPDNDNELPIPRPYGSHAPFKPSDAGSSMRHTRKPIPKPIEI